MVAVAFGVVDFAAIVKGNHVFRIELDGLIVVGDGAIEIALGLEQAGAVAVDPGIAGIEPGRPVVVGDGMVEVALGAVQVAAIVERSAVVGIERDRTVVIRDGAIDIAQGGIGVAAIEQQAGERGSAVSSGFDSLGATADLLAPRHVGLAGAFQIIERIGRGRCRRRDQHRRHGRQHHQVSVQHPASISSRDVRVHRRTVIAAGSCRPHGNRWCVCRPGPSAGSSPAGRNAYR